MVSNVEVDGSDSREERCVRSEVWAFCGGAVTSNAAAKLASEAARVSQMLGAIPCGLTVVADAAGMRERLKLFGLRKLYAANCSNVSLSCEAWADVISSLVASLGPQMLLFASDALGSELAARVAARLGAGLVANCTDFGWEDGTFVAYKAGFAGEVTLITTWSEPRLRVATVDLDACEALPERTPVVLEVVTVDVAEVRSDPRVEILVRWKPDPMKIALVEAPFVIGLGKPVLARPEEQVMLHTAIEEAGAAIGVSRPVADAGVFPRERQIGASGKWLSAEVYIACGISGSAYHMMGVKKVRHLIAVNTDPGAPIFRHAELGIVCDLFQLLPALAKLLKSGSKEPKSPSVGGESCSYG